MEIWKDIGSLPEFQASSLGRIRMKPFKKPMPNGGERIYGGKPRVGCWDRCTNRYGLVFRQRNYKVARLICEAFHGPPSCDDSVCMHLDEDSRNNRPENLAWGTQKQNLNAPGFIEYCRSRTGENNPRIKGMTK